LVSSPALSNWTACACCRNRRCARTASAPGVWLGMGNCYLRRGLQPGPGLRTVTWPHLAASALPGGWRTSGDAACDRTKVSHPHTHPFTHLFHLPPCPHSKSGDNSSSSLGDVVTGTRRPTPPASGKSYCQPRGWGGTPGWGGLSTA
jgi:hypothetical protein